MSKLIFFFKDQLLSYLPVFIFSVFGYSTVISSFLGFSESLIAPYFPAESPLQT